MYEEEYEDNDLFYTMKDPTKLVNEIRKLVFAGFGLENLNDEELQYLVSEIDEEEMDRTISLKECEIIAMEYLKTKKFKTKTKYILSDKDFNDLVEAINARLVSNLLTGLVDKGQIESAWDSEANDFIFWVKDNESD